jgi:NADH-quinone oxidoreductase subunit C
MNFQEILEKIKSKHEVLESKEDIGILNAYIAPAMIARVAAFLKDELQFEQLNFITAVDLPANNVLEVVYRFFSYATADSAVLRVKLDREKPSVETISGVFKTADWHERETSEMFGVTFLNHPDPNRLILPDGIVAPLRKDYKNPDMTPLPKV